jgi:glycosyltransferase involved in cell wall biosynthesis
MTKFETDPKFSLIVPVYDVPMDVFKRCLMSIEDQDYPNLEVIIVPNGDPKAEEYAKEYSKGKENWKVLPLPEKGAARAKNYGFDNSTGEIVSFFCSDYVANPGMVRMWVDKLIAHPECQFVYGAYEYNVKGRNVYWSKEFDLYQEEVANFIDSGFPIWRKYSGRWDENVKSLQDWDYWLNIIKVIGKNKFKGFYLDREISFIAEQPRPEGLSMDSNSKWMERTGFIKNKYGIPIRDICLASIGAPNHAIKIAKMINADYRDDTLHKQNNYKSVYLIGWYMKPGEKSNDHSEVVRYFPNSRKIIHFVGADIYWLRKFSTEKIRQWAGAMTMIPEVHFLSENEAAYNELKSYGLETEIVPIPPYTNLDVTPLPREFSVAVYLTDRSDFDKYLQKHTLSIVKAMPDVKFYGYGDAALDGFKSANFEHKGTMETDEWAKFVCSNSAYLRIVKHDTRPMASDEFILAGRSVVTNIPAPYMEVVDTSGRDPFDRWDMFAPGFNPRRWPETKKKLIQAIRAVRKKQDSPDFIGEAIVAAARYKMILDKTKYIQKINDLSKSKVKELEVI